MEEASRSPDVGDSAPPPQSLPGDVHWTLVLVCSVPVAVRGFSARCQLGALLTSRKPELWGFSEAPEGLCLFSGALGLSDRLSKHFSIRRNTMLCLQSVFAFLPPRG